MNCFLFLKHIIKIIVSVTIIFFNISCKKQILKQSDFNQKEVSIEYRITPEKKTVANGVIIYTDEAGVVTVSDSKTLPFSKKIKRTINKYAIISLGIIADDAGSVKMEILVNDKIVSELIPNNVFSKRKMMKYKIII